MLDTHNSLQRCPFPYGDDCTASFIEQADNRKALVDVFEINAKGELFKFHMMKMKTSKGPWVFGSFSHKGQHAWSFREDVRVREDDFKGAVTTHVHNHKTYALFTQARTLEHAVPFVKMLFDPGMDPEYVDDVDVCHVHYALMRDIAQEAKLRLTKDVAEVLVPSDRK